MRPMFAFQLVCLVVSFGASTSYVNSNKGALEARGGDNITQCVGTPLATHKQNGNLFLKSQIRCSFRSVTYVAVANLIFNVFRPDDSISWQMRIPRAAWEVILIVLSKSLTDSTAPFPAMYLLFAIVAGLTALIDLFIWAPIFATFASFETCEGFFWRRTACRLDYSKGFGRLFVVFQCFVSGFIYLFAAITAMGSFASLREEQKVVRQLHTMHIWDKIKHTQGQNSPNLF
mmetsp:Transcript_1919/g.2824  ORF Transcript_1919/g.2824 Transcript_1919/m.2824 type:complete len:231 (+) Transcript_1919:341-1033(+)